MHDQFFKLRPIPNHFHREDQIVCEKCMSQFASSGNPLIDAVREYFYVTGQLTSMLMENAFNKLIVLGRNLKPLVENISEFLYMTNELMLLVAQILLIAGMGLAMLVAALFPTLTGGKSAYEQSLDQQARERRQRHLNERQKEIDEQEEFEKNRQKLNSPDLSLRVFQTHEERLEDEQLVKEINNTDNPEEKLKKSDELLKARLEAARKDARRQELYDRCRDKDCEAKKLFVAALDAYKKGEYEESGKLEGQSHSAQEEANRLYMQFLSV